MSIRKAQRRQTKIKMGFFGPSGSGKTHSALLTAIGLTAKDWENPTPAEWEKVVVVCTEWQDDFNTAADLYASLGPFDVYPLKPPYSPERFINAIQECINAGYEAIVVDSISDEWEGEGGCLDLKEKLSKDKNSFTVWNELGARHLKLVHLVTQAPAHILICGRVKVDYVMEETVNKAGKTVQSPVKKGMKVITREGLDYQITLAMDLDISHYATCSKDRVMGMDPRPIDNPPFIINPEFGHKLARWCNEGTDARAEEIERLSLVEDVRTYANNIGIKTAEEFAEVSGITSTNTASLEELRNAHERIAKEAIRRGLAASDVKPNERPAEENAGSPV